MCPGSVACSAFVDGSKCLGVVFGFWDYFDSGLYWLSVCGEKLIVLLRGWGCVSFLGIFCVSGAFCVCGVWRNFEVELGFWDVLGPQNVVCYMYMAGVEGLGGYY